jgi:hypothetical protein
MQAKDAEEAGDTETEERLLAIAEQLEWEKIDEVELDVRHRVVRVERFIRSGPEGPEPPRSSDFDEHEHSKLRQSAGPDPAEGFVLDPTVPTGMSEGILKTDLIQLLPKRASVSDEVYDEALQAGYTHPGVVLMPVAFAVAQCQSGMWGSFGIMDCPTPFRARDVLSMHLRVSAPVYDALSEEQRAQYAAAADRLEASGSNELTVGDRLLRIIRIERMVRFGPDGPEGPRSSDPDPEDPVKLMYEKLRAQGIDPDEDEPIELNDSAKEFQRLFEAEMSRRGMPMRPDQDQIQDQDQPADEELSTDQAVTDGAGD